ncbi:MAG TPA: rhodanese-like domain-containing protein [Gemmataceae bacterium]|nr:rhodanese-like domain-containing protein [Gemmataceae bacterium]
MVPLSDLRGRADKALLDKNAEIVVYCASSSCDAAEKACGELTNMGYRNVKDYSEGKADWVHARHPIEGKAPITS